MKKLLTFLMVTLFACQLGANAAIDWTTATGIAKVNTIGYNLLLKNKLPDKIVFKVEEVDEVNAFANTKGEIHVYTGLLKFVSDDQELAAVISHEIGHIVNHHGAKQNTIASVGSALISVSGLSQGAQDTANIAGSVSLLKLSRTDEYEADITGIDLLVKAGYNPLAMISLLNSLNAGGNTVDFLSTHPTGDKRTMNAYNYLFYAYPTQAKAAYNNASYEAFLAYAQPVVEKRNANEKALAKFNKQQKKLQGKRVKKMAKYQKQYGTSAWDKAFITIKVINALTAPQ
jgi:predicted Zn-dependent protease